MGEKETASSLESGRMKAGLDTAAGALATGAARQASSEGPEDAARAGQQQDPDTAKHVHQHNQTDLDFVQ